MLTRRNNLFAIALVPMIALLASCGGGGGANIFGNDPGPSAVTTPDDTTPDNTTPDNTTPDNTTPDNTTPDDTATDDTATDDTTTDDTTTDDTTTEPKPNPEPEPDPTDTTDPEPDPEPTPPTPPASIFPVVAPTAAALNNPPPSNYADLKRQYEEGEEYTQIFTRLTQSLQGRDAHLGRINAAAAYARGATGAGETIVVMDTGVLETHNELNFGKVIKVAGNSYTPTAAQKNHGTAVAAVAVGHRFGTDIHGVAFDAKVRFREVCLGCASTGGTRPYSPADLTSRKSANDDGYADFLRPTITLARRAGASNAIINLSWGITGGIARYTESQVTGALARTAEVLEQPRIAPADKKIIVWAAGNAGTRMLKDGSKPKFEAPEIFPGLGVHFPKLRGHVIAVVALKQDGTIADFSNRCGMAKQFCLAAPGEAIYSADTDSETNPDLAYRFWDGTSFAAPIVSGALAVMRQFFRNDDGTYQLGNTELVKRLLGTANRTKGMVKYYPEVAAGTPLVAAEHAVDYSDSDIYGHGVVDLDAATRPVGVVMLAMPGTPGNQPLATSGIALSGGAFGGAAGGSLQGQLAKVQITGFDALAAPFARSAWVAGAVQGEDVDYRVRDVPLSPSLVSRGLAHLQDADEKTAGARLSLGMAGGDIADAQIDLGDWWVSYGHHGGRALGLYADQFGAMLGSGESGQGNVGRVGFGAQDFIAPYLALVRHGPGMGWSRSTPNGGLGFALMRGTPQFDREPSAGGARGMGTLFDYRRTGANGRGGLSLQTGAVREGNGFLGARPQGAFGKARGATTFAGVSGAWALTEGVARDEHGGGSISADHPRGGWYMQASAYLGRTRIETDGAGLRAADTITSSAFSLGAARNSLWRSGDWFGLRLSQPLRVENGKATLRLPSGRTKYGEVLHQEHRIRLAPNGRTLRVEATYRLPVAGGAVSANLGLERHPQHDRNRATQPFFGISFKRQF